MDILCPESIANDNNNSDKLRYVCRTSPFRKLQISIYFVDLGVVGDIGKQLSTIGVETPADQPEKVRESRWQTRNPSTHARFKTTSKGPFSAVLIRKLK